MRSLLILSLAFHVMGCPFTLMYAFDEDASESPQVTLPRCEICPEFDWVEVAGGTFTMGHPDLENSRPLREVTVPTFWMTRHEVTVDQYSWIESVNDELVPSERNRDVCNYFSADSELPMNCVSYDDASAFAWWVGAKLPSEAQWAYAARNGVLETRFPWGDEPTTCSHAHGEGCAPSGQSQSVCLTPDGENEWGICDLMGNLSEWTADDLHMNFEGAPTDGSAWRAAKDAGASATRLRYRIRPAKVIRGSSFQHAPDPHSAVRRWLYPHRAGVDIGFRLVRDTAP
jgi:formylglycine-generating enzyme required for sulfatase activity